MIVGIKGIYLYFLKYFMKTFLFRDIISESKCVHKETNLILEIRMVSSRDNGSDDDIFLSSIFMKQDIHDSLQKHEETNL